MILCRLFSTYKKARAKYLNLSILLAAIHCRKMKRPSLYFLRRPFSLVRGDKMHKIDNNETYSFAIEQNRTNTGGLDNCRTGFWSL